MDGVEELDDDDDDGDVVDGEVKGTGFKKSAVEAGALRTEIT